MSAAPATARRPAWPRRAPDAGLLGLALLLTGLSQGTLALSRAFLNSDRAGTLLFLASAYDRHPFDPWDDRWYTGLPLTGLPPLVPQLLAGLTGPLSAGGAYGAAQLLSTLLLVLGVYRAGRALGPAPAAALAATLAGTSAALAIQLSVFGHLDAVLGAALILHAVPALRAALHAGQRAAAWAAGLGLFAAGLACPGAALPLGTLVVLGLAGTLPAHAPERWPRVWRLAALSLLPGLWMLGVTLAWRGPAGVSLHLPGVPAAAGRDILVTLLLPLTGLLWALPGLWRRGRPASGAGHADRAADDGAVALARVGAGLVAIAALAVLGARLGTPGLVATPPETLLFFGVMLGLPLTGQVALGLWAGAGARGRSGLLALGAATVLLGLGLNALGTRRALEPARIDLQPILNFIEKDEHWRYRFLTVGFGRQLALMSAATRAGTPSGLLHLEPELPRVLGATAGLAALPERLALPGLGTLDALLTHPERTHLKFVYARSTVFDPLLHFSGWHRVSTLENGVHVWEREDIPPVPARPARGELPAPLGVLWGTLPLLALVGMALGALWAARTAADQPRTGPPTAEPLRPALGLLLGALLLAGGALLWPRVWAPRAAALAAAAQAPDGGGLRGDYARLDSVQGSGAGLRQTRRWWTSLGPWSDELEVPLTWQGLGWRAAPTAPQPRQATTGPDSPGARPAVAYYRSPRRLTAETTAAADVLDRPLLRRLGTRLLLAPDGSLQVVGELLNIDARPGDTTLSVIVRGPDGQALTRENAGRLTLHTLRPGERTPFRVAFAPGSLTLPPGTPLNHLSIEVAARAVVTGRGQARPLAARSRVRAGRLEVVVTNLGALSVQVPQALVTLLDADGAAWVQEVIGTRALPPGGQWAFSVPARVPGGLSTLSRLPPEPSPDAPQGPAPGTFARPGGSYRLTLNAFAPGEPP